MKALVQDGYVSAKGTVRLDDVEMPSVGDTDVLVRVRAASAKLYGWDLPIAIQWMGRMAARLREPKAHVPGLDFAGEVEAVGKDVRQYHSGLAVFGWSKGALAEYVAVDPEALAAKPESLSFPAAATVAMAGITAVQAVRKGQVTSGDDVLVVGASGGVGTFAIQLAKARGANVTGVCSTPNLDLVRSLGADHVIDYSTQDFTRDGRRHDAILDMAGNRSLTDLRRSLRSGGTLVMVGQSGIPTTRQSWFKSLSRWLQAALWSRFISQRFVALIQTKNHEDLLALQRSVEEGELTPTVTDTYPLSQAPEAIAQLNEGHGRGRVVIEFPATST